MPPNRPLATLAITLMTLALLLTAVACQRQVSSSQPVDPDGFYDVIVAGGEPEAVAAAVSAARNGCNTLLLVKENALGGLFTLAMMNTLDLNYAPGGGLANTGIFEEFFRAIGRKEAFDVGQAKQALQELVQGESNLTVLYQRSLLAAVWADEADGGADVSPLAAPAAAARLKGVRVKTPGGVEEYHGQVLIDATADGDLAALCGVPYTLLREDMGVPGVGMGCTLMLHLRQVDWAAVRAEAASGRLGHANSSDSAAWGFSRIARLYQPRDPDTFLRGLNIGRQNDGSVLINALVIFGVNPLDEESYRQGLAKGRAEAEHVVAWLRQNVGGFAQAELAPLPEALYVRESRHSIGLYRLTVSDVLDSRMFPDAIAFGSYPLDIQAATPTDSGFVVGRPRLYSIPLRCLIPQEVGNLLTAGRSASYDSLAAGSARVVPVGMAVAEAAGVGAKVMLQAGISAQELAQAEFYTQVQERLQAQGVRWLVGDYASAFPDQAATPALKRLVELGLVIGGYGNNWRLDERADERLAAQLMAVGMQRVRTDAKQAAEAVYVSGQVGVPLSRERLQALAATALGQLPLDNWQRWLEELVSRHAAASYSRGALYQFVAELLGQLQEK